MHSFSLPTAGSAFSSPSKLFAVSFGNAKFFHDWHAVNGGSTDVQILPWRELSKGIGRRAATQAREQHFRIRVAATTTRCLEEHRWLHVEGSSNKWRFEARNRLMDTPFPDAFVVEFAVEVTAQRGALAIRCFANVHFAQHIPLLTEKILTGTLAQYKISFGNLERLLLQRGSSISLAPKCGEEVSQPRPCELHARCIRLQCATFHKEPAYLAVSEAKTKHVRMLCGGFHRPSLSEWRLAVLPNRAGNRIKVSLQNVATNKFLGHDMGGQVVAAASKCGRWEVWELEFREADDSVAFVNADWGWGRGGYLCCSERDSTAVRISALEHSTRGAAQLEFRYALSTDCAGGETSSKNCRQPRTWKSLALSPVPMEHIATWRLKMGECSGWQIWGTLFMVTVFLFNIGQCRADH